MNYLVLLGVLVVIVGFALKLDSILIIAVASIVTAITGRMGIVEFLDVFGATFVGSRYMNVFLIVLLLTGTLERNGLKHAAAKLIGKFKGATPAHVLGVYSVLRGILGAFNVGLGGVAGFTRPVLMPMCQAAIETKGYKANEEHMDHVKGMAAGVENIAWFFTQVLFIGGSGGLLVKSAMESLGYNVELPQLAAVEIPVAIFAILFTIIYYNILDKRYMKKYYGEINIENK